jgi:hypothetical protein
LRNSLAWLFLAACCQGREVLTLRNGFTLEVSSHTLRNGSVVAQTGSGSVEIPETEIALIEVFPEALPVHQATPPPATAEPEVLLRQAAVSQGLAPELLRSVAKVESGLQPNAISPKGAVGLMQLMPQTAASLQVLAADPAGNARGGALYLRQLLLQYHGNAALALAAYNAGPGAVDRYRGVPPYAETRRYVVRVLTELAKEQRQKQK